MQPSRTYDPYNLQLLTKPPVVNDIRNADGVAMGWQDQRIRIRNDEWLAFASPSNWPDATLIGAKKWKGLRDSTRRRHAECACYKRVLARQTQFNSSPRFRSLSQNGHGLQRRQRRYPIERVIRAHGPWPVCAWDTQSPATGVCDASNAASR